MLTFINLCLLQFALWWKLSRSSTEQLSAQFKIFETDARLTQSLSLSKTLAYSPIGAELSGCLIDVLSIDLLFEPNKHITKPSNEAFYFCKKLLNTKELNIYTWASIPENKKPLDKSLIVKEMEEKGILGYRSPQTITEEYVKLSNNIKRATKNQTSVLYFLKESLMEPEKSIYTTVACFEEKWQSPFSKRSIKEFQKSGHGAHIERDFVYLEIENYKYNKHEGSNGFEAIALPFVNKNRWIVYILPNKYCRELSFIWTTYLDKCGNGLMESSITKELEKDNEEKIKAKTYLQLCMPVVDVEIEINLRTAIRIEKGEKNYRSTLLSSAHYGDNYSKSDIIDHTNNLFSHKIFLNKPYISFVYDVNLQRMLFFMTDHGPQSKQSKE